jgi:hypothetical protein
VIPTILHPIAFYTYHSQKTILSLAIPDEALLHSILAYSMIHKFCFQSDSEPSQLAKVRFAESNPEGLANRTRAIHLIDKKLNGGVASETIIAAVLVLLLHHVSSCHTLISSSLESLVIGIDIGCRKTRSGHTYLRTEKIDRASWRLETLSPSLAGGIAL